MSRREISGQQYEALCAGYLRQNGFREISFTKASRDQGVDLLAKSGRLRYGIQCKYYGRTVGNKAVQEAYAGACYYDCDVAVVMTNADFTAPAKDLAASNGVLLWGNYTAEWLKKCIRRQKRGVLFGLNLILQVLTLLILAAGIFRLSQTGLQPVQAAGIALMACAAILALGGGFRRVTLCAAAICSLLSGLLFSGGIDPAAVLGWPAWSSEWWIMPFLVILIRLFAAVVCRFGKRKRRLQPAEERTEEEMESLREAIILQETEKREEGEA